jgi:hypothetical protein
MCQFALSETNVIDSEMVTIDAVNPPSIVCDPFPSIVNVAVPAVFLMINIAVLPTAVGNVMVYAPPAVDAKITFAPDVAVSVYVVETDVTEYEKPPPPPVPVVVIMFPDESNAKYPAAVPVYAPELV